MRGFRKVDNYYNKFVIPDMNFHAHRKQEPEEFEQHIVQREQHRETLLSHHVVERVIDSQNGDDGLEYFVKCRLADRAGLLQSC